MRSNANASIDTSVNVPSQTSSQPMDPRVIQFNRVSVKQTSGRPQNQRLSNILQGLIALQLAANDTDNNPKDGTAMSSDVDKRKRAAINKEEEEGEAPPAKRSRSAVPSSPTDDPTEIEAHDDEAAKPIPFADGREYQAVWYQDQYIVKDRIIDFLYDVPGWGPNRVVPPIGEVVPVTIGDQVYDEDEELMFTMDDLFDFDRYHAS